MSETGVQLSERCAVQAGSRGDPMLGTAFPASVLLLVEQPGPWGRTGLLDSRFDRVTAHRLIGALNRQQVRVLAIRRPGRTVIGSPRRWAAVDCRPGRERLVWGRFEDDRDLLELHVRATLEATSPATAGPLAASAPPEEVTDDQAPLFAVCAHGMHDVCCAIRGRPVAAALEQLRPGRVWECSHVGGDRFAANVLVLPSGILYGRVVAPAAQAIVDAADRGLVVDQHLRGRVGLAPEVQAAMALAHRERPGLTFSDIRAGGHSRVADDLTIVRLHVADQLVDVEVRVERSSTEWLTCQSSQPSTANVYQPMSFRPVAQIVGH